MTSSAIRCPVRLSSCMLRIKLRKSGFVTPNVTVRPLCGFLRRSILLKANGKFFVAPGTFFVPVLMFHGSERVANCNR
jgi:hypothetical protein